MIEILIMTLLFILLCAFMALIEASLLSITHGEVDELCIRNAWGAQALKSLTERNTQALTVIVGMTNLIYVLGTILVSQRAIQLYGDSSIVVMTILLTMGTIVFSEILPKSLGTHYAPTVSRLAAPPIRVLVYALYPVVTALEWLSNLLKSGERRLGTETQIRSLVSRGRRAGLIEQHEGRMIRRAFVLNDRTVKDIMTPLSQVITMNDSATIREAAARLLQHRYSRYPVIGESSDDVIGIVMSRDILQALAYGKGDQSVSSLSMPCLRVPASLQSDAMLVKFRDRHIHLAIVRDGNQTLGVVTLEDVLEQLVGEIEDEKDVAR